MSRKKHIHDEHIASDWFCDSGVNELNLCENCPMYRRTYHDYRKPPLEPDEYDCPAGGEIVSEKCTYYVPVIKDIMKTLQILDDALYEAKLYAEH